MWRLARCSSFRVGLVVLSFTHQLYLLLSQAIPRQAIWETFFSFQHTPSAQVEIESLRHAALDFANQLPRGRNFPRWPDLRHARALATRFERHGIRLLWRGFPDYPARLAKRLSDAPHWVWLAGDQSRLKALTCAVVGSRQTAPKYLKAAAALGRVLAQSGVPIASGLAEGADFAAQSGAMQTPAGTIAFPARGILRIDLSPTRPPQNTMTALALDLPDDPISASKAVRRNSMIAAMGEGLVLVASSLTGGSSYAVRWALSNGMPLWAFESGRDTPAANRQLINAGKAIALNIADPPEQWVHSIKPAILAHQKQSQQKNAGAQLDWLKA